MCGHGRTDCVQQLTPTTWECVSCAVQVELPRDGKPVTMLWTPGGGRLERVIFFGGRQVHRCTPDETARQVSTT